MASLLVGCAAAVVKPLQPPAGSPGAEYPTAGTAPAKAPGFADPKSIAACLASVGFQTGEWQPVPGGRWLAISHKFLVDGDISLSVGGASAVAATALELEATSTGSGRHVARRELLHALQLLLTHLGMSFPPEVAESIEADRATMVGIPGAELHFSSREVAGTKMLTVLVTQK